MLAEVTRKSAMATEYIWVRAWGQNLTEIQICWLAGWLAGCRFLTSYSKNRKRRSHGLQDGKETLLEREDMQVRYVATQQWVSEGTQCLLFGVFFLWNLEEKGVAN